MTTPTYDLIVIGAGPGGYIAAIRASQLGLKTAVVEREHLGGVCLNWGCIPTKALLRSAELFRSTRHAAAFGFEVDGKIKFNAHSLVERSRRVAAQLNKGVGFLLSKNNVDLIWGEASIIAPGHVEVSAGTKPPTEPQPKKPNVRLGPGRYKANNIIVATGSRPRFLPGLEPDGETIWSYFEAMVPKEIPKTISVIGAGAIGIEFASFYNMLGANVTVIEALPEILATEDQEIAKLARKAFEADGINILCNARVVNAEQNDSGICIEVETGDGEKQSITAERLISAVGVIGNVEGLGLQDAGVETENNTIKVGPLGATNVRGIYAIGDVAGGPMLAHKAEREGIICAEAIAGHETHALDRLKIPNCIYSHPQVASVGQTEWAARDSIGNIKVGRFPFRSNGKAIALGEPEGMIKTIFDGNTGQLVGAHLIGAEVTELVQGFVIGMQLETTEEELIRSIFPHPTLSESMQESVLDAFGRAIHK